MSRPEKPIAPQAVPDGPRLVPTEPDLPRDVEELRRLLLEERQRSQVLERDRAEVRGLDELKSSIAALLCHELRGSLCVVAGFLDMAGEDFAERITPATRELLDGANLQMDRLTSLLQELCDFSQLQLARAGGADLLPLDEIVENVQAALAPQLTELHVRLQTNLHAEAADCALHADLTGLLLRSLLGGVVRFDPRPEHVSLRSRKLDLGLEIEIAVPSASLPATLREVALESLEPSAPAPRRNRSGLVLALWTASRSATLLGAELALHAEPGAGSRFVVQLPIPPS